MTLKHQWFLIESDTDYNAAIARYEQVKGAPKGSDEHKEKLLLVHLISEYEKLQWDLPDANPVELIKI